MHHACIAGSRDIDSRTAIEARRTDDFKAGQAAMR
jgi:hypothetical protein